MRGELPFRLILGAVLAAFTAVRTCYGVVMLRSLRSGVAEAHEARVPLLAALALLQYLGFIGASVWLVAPRGMAWSALPLPRSLRWLGATLSVAGLLLLGWTHLVLGRNFSGIVALRKDHQLVTTGPYRWVRHPMYTAFFVLLPGLFLLSANWLIGSTLIGSMAAIIALRLRKEEQLLLDRFGDAYRAYAERTGRFLPRIGSVGNSTPQDHPQEAR